MFVKLIGLCAREVSGGTLVSSWVWVLLGLTPVVLWLGFGALLGGIMDDKGELLLVQVLAWGENMHAMLCSIVFTWAALAAIGAVYGM